MSVGRELRGVGVSPGLAVAPAAAVAWSFPDVADRTVDPSEVDHEIDRLRDAVAAVSDELGELRRRTEQRAGSEEAGIFDAQIMMTQDEEFLAGVELLIRKNNLAAETAYEFKALEIRNAWSSSSMSVLRDRLADLHAIQLRMLAHLMGRAAHEAWVGEEHGQVVLVARELSPGLIVQLDRDQVIGVISEEGTRTSHAAILAHSLGIPAVMGVPDAMRLIREGEMLLLDGHTGTVIVEPSLDALDLARLQASRRAKLEMQLEGIAGEPAVTPDGTRIALLANVDLPEEVEPSLYHGAEGVGLLRTEFLVTGRTELPSEAEQTEYYRRVGAAFAGRPVIVRSYDLGGDKFPAAFEAPHEANPFLGWRSIRVCLDQPEIFRPQLRAMLRASASRDLSLMLPMVMSLSEVRETRAMIAEEAAALHAEGRRTADDLSVGVMIETPAAVLLIEDLAREVAFVSVGTNDLTQYTLAVDRGNARLAARFSSLHPAVLRQLDQVRRATRTAGIPAGVCGEMASDPIAVVALLGLGFDSLSVAPPSVPLVKWVIRHLPFAAAAEATAAALTATDTEEIRAVLREALGRHLDLRLVDPAGSLPRLSGGTSLPLTP